MAMLNNQGYLSMKISPIWILDLSWIHQVRHQCSAQGPGELRLADAAAQGARCAAVLWSIMILIWFQTSFIQRLTEHVGILTCLMVLLTHLICFCRLLVKFTGVSSVFLPDHFFFAQSFQTSKNGSTINVFSQHCLNPGNFKFTSAKPTCSTSKP